MNNAFTEHLELLHQEDKHEEIINEILAIDEDKRSYDLISMLARAYNNVEQYENAIELLKSVREAGKEDCLWYFRLGYAYYYNSQYKIAREVFEESLRLNEQDADSWLLLYYTLQALEENEEAEKASMRYKELAPGSWAEYIGDQPCNPGEDNREISYMMAVVNAKDKIEDYDAQHFIKQLHNVDGIELKDFDFDDEKNCPVFKVAYLDHTYEFNLYVEDFEMTDLYRINHQLSDENMIDLEQAKFGITIAMNFGPESLDSFHLQLKLLYCLVPTMVTVTDFSAMNVFSPVWVKMTAESLIPPAPDYLYSVHGVSSQENGVWLHTHGLNRCGFTELEVLNSNVEAYRDHLEILNAMAKRAISDGEMADEGEAVYIAQTTSGSGIVCTWQDWEKVIDEYPSDMLGGRNDRKEDHNKHTGILYVYPSEEDYNEGHYIPLTDLPADVYENPLIMISNKETQRMSDLAKERFSYLRTGLLLPAASAIVKLGLKVDENKIEEAGTEFEHIWFEVKQISEERITAKLIQDPYYIENLSIGSEVTLDISYLTDWILYLEDISLTPDTSYLLEGKILVN